MLTWALVILFPLLAAAMSRAKGHPLWGYWFLVLGLGVIAQWLELRPLWWNLMFFGSMVLGGLVSAGIALKQGRWVCRKCSVMNYRVDKQCRCGQPRPYEMESTG